MKKTAIVIAAAGMILTAGTVFAADSIDSYGRMNIGITAPEKGAVSVANTPTVKFDSEGRFTAAAPAVLGGIVAASAPAGKKVCLDSECKVNLKM